MKTRPFFITAAITCMAFAFSVNPAYGYYPVSPYAYCMNNPVRYIVPTGKWGAGTDGKPVTFTNGQWSSNASTDVQRVGNAMMMTNKGTERLNAMMSNKTSISIKLSPDARVEGKSLVAGKVNNVKFTVKDGKVDVKSLDLNIYEGSIKDLTNPNGTYYDPKIDGLTLDEAIGAVAGHESEHTETSNIQQQWDNQQNQNNKTNVEFIPNRTEQEISDELKNRTGQ
jgi:hypothetical protein